MMLTIHGLPLPTKYHDLKVLIKQQCNITDFILDNLTSDVGGTKKVRIGVSDDREGSYLMKCLDGFLFSGNQLKVLPIGKPMTNAPQNMEQRGGGIGAGFPPRNDYQSQSGPNYNNRSMDPMPMQDNMMRQDNMRPDPMQGRPDPMHGRQDPMHGRPDPMRGRPDSMQGRLEPMHGRPDPLPGRPDAMHGRPDPMHGRPDPMHGRPDPMHERPDPMHGRPEPMHGRPDPMHGRPDPMHGRPDPMHGRPDPMHGRPDNIHGRIDPVRERQDSMHSRPDPIHGGRSDPYGRDSMYGRQEPMNNRDPIRGRPDPMHGRSEPLSGRPDPMPGRPDPWGPSSNQWGSNQGPAPGVQNNFNDYPQKPQMNNYGQPNASGRPDGRPFDQREPYDGRGPPSQDPGYGFPPKNDVNDPALARRGNLRSVEIVDEPLDRPIAAPRYPNQSYDGQKPMTIMKDNFQGPQYNLDRQPLPGPTAHGYGQDPGHPAPGHGQQPWAQPMHAPKPSPTYDRKFPDDKRPPPKSMVVEPYKEYDKGPRFSPRRDVPRLSPGRRMSPGRKSPGRRISPGDRRPPMRDARSPLRRDSPPRGMRYSPGRRDKPPEKYPERGKDVRPAYEPSQAQNQAMYSEGYRPSLRENAQYPAQGMRPQEASRSPWQQERDKHLPGGLKPEEDRRDLRMPKFEPRIDSNLGPKRISRSPPKSRSPVRHRSPVDRYRKHSPSPRSPRRSWALEKRRSPDVHDDAPPPPIWPGQPNDDPYRNRADFHDGKKSAPVWEPRVDPKDDRRRPDVEGRYDEIRVRTDLGPRPARQPSPRGFKPEERFPARDSRDPKFEPRDPKFEPRDPKFEPRDPKFEPRRDPKFEPREEFSRGDFRRPDEKRYDRPEFRDVRRPDDDFRPKDDRRLDTKRDEFARGDPAVKLTKHQETFQKEFDDIYMRAVQFREKAEELRRREALQERDRREVGRTESRDDRRPRDEDRHRDARFDDRRKEELSRHDPKWKDEEKRNADIAAQKAKKDKAIDEIAEKMIHKYGCDWSADIRRRVMEELRLSLSKILQDMFGNSDVSFIEMVVKFNAKFDSKSQAKIFSDVMDSFPAHYMKMKRFAAEPPRSDIPAKIPKRSADMKRDVVPAAADPLMADAANWMMQQNMQMMMSPMDMSQMMMVPTVPGAMMLPTPAYSAAPFTSRFDVPPELEPEPRPDTPQPPIPPKVRPDTPDEPPKKPDDGYNLYLCKDDFEPYTSVQAEYLKKFLVSQIVKASEHGWSPDFTIKGLQSMCRYEVYTKDENTKNWLSNLDFSEFHLFNVLVYTKEELWYERAAIWLPGHSKVRNIEPLTKLKLQNKKLEGVKIGKWKFVKKIVQPKGIRVYVDMPPSSARALEKHKMMLSYELQKVHVYLKAVAVDKDVFDAGMRGFSVRDETELIAASENAPMPSLAHEANIVRIGLKGNKAMSVLQAQKVKNMLIYQIFKYQQNDGTSKTDFVKYGFCAPGFFGVVPENNESKRWLSGLDIGKLKKHQLVVLCADDTSTKMVKMTIVARAEDRSTQGERLILERLKQGNQGVKGLNFSLWKPVKLTSSRERGKLNFEVKMDLESVETIMKLNYKLDYIDERQKNIVQSATVKSEYSHSRLQEKIKRLKDEMHDSYDVANMELASSDEDGDDIVFVGEIR